MPLPEAYCRRVPKYLDQAVQVCGAVVRLHRDSDAGVPALLAHGHDDAVFFQMGDRTIRRFPVGAPVAFAPTLSPD